MTENQLTIGELIEALQKLPLPKSYKVNLSVRYDDCEHIQPLRGVTAFISTDIDWIVLRGGKND